MADGGGWPREPEGFVRYRCLGGHGEDGIDLRRCRRFIVEMPSEDEPSADIRIYYLTPEGLWIEFLRARDPGDGSWYEVYSQVDPIHAAHQFWINDPPFRRLPPELEPFRRHADHAAYAEWLAAEEVRLRDPRKARPVTAAAVIDDGRSSLDSVREEGWDLHKWIERWVPISLEFQNESSDLFESGTRRDTRYPVANPRFYPWDKLFERATQRVGEYRERVLGGRWSDGDLAEEMLQGWLLNAVDVIAEEIVSQNYYRGERLPDGIRQEGLAGLVDALHALEAHLLNGSNDPEVGVDSIGSASPQSSGGEESAARNKDTDRGDEPADEPDSDTANGLAGTSHPSQPIHVQQLDGQMAITESGDAARWPSIQHQEIDVPLRWTEDLYRTKGGRWFVQIAYDRPSVIWDDGGIPSPDEALEVTEDRIVEWFLKEWDRRAGDSLGIPDHVRRLIAESDLDRGEAVKSDSQPEMAGDDRSSEVKKYWRVLQVYRDRVHRNESVSVRAIARAAGCSKGYVSKILKKVRGDRADAVPRGSKDRDGTIEAFE